MDGNWAVWSDWSVCDATCDNGTRTRTRTCTDPVPVHGGTDCTGKSRETMVCENNFCPGNVLNTVFKLRNIVVYTNTICLYIRLSVHFRQCWVCSFASILGMFICINIGYVHFDQCWVCSFPSMLGMFICINIGYVHFHQCWVCSFPSILGIPNNGGNEHTQH